MSGPRITRAASIVGAASLLAAIAGLGGWTSSLFAGQTVNAGSQFRVAPDFVAPSAGASVIAKTAGYSPGYIHQGGTYRVHASVTDSGNPPSGVESVAADVSSITSGATAAALTAGTFSAGGVSYDRRSASITANGTLAEGVYTYSLTSTDAAGNARTQGGFTVVVDNTAPGAADVQTANAGGGTAGRAEAGDTITYSFTEPIDPHSVLTGWDGAPTDVVVRIVNGTILLGNDTLQIHDSADSAQLPLGSVNLGRDDYVGGLLGLGEATRFGATGTPSSMALSGSTITITLGTAGSGATTAGGNGTVRWSPSTSPYDRAGNAATSASVNETGSADREF